jgi:hypothetical protein
MNLDDEHRLNRYSGWIRVELADGRVGWARNEEVFIT